ncbi:MAG: transglycosylase domain-containing protein [Myxococcales bacterium]|nr:transglycosylase domain-containing protein [Myxococcales bacterium]
MRRPLLMAGGGLLGLLLLAGVVVWILYDRIGEWAIREKVLPRLEARLGRAVEVGSIDVDRGRVVLRGVVVPSLAPGTEPLVRVDALEVDYDYGASWLGRVRLFEARAEGLTAHASRRADGTSELREFMQKFRGPTGEEGASSGGGGNSLRPKKLRLSEGTVHLVDEVTGRTVNADIAFGQADRGQDAMLEIDELRLDSRAEFRDLIVTIDPKEPLSSAKVEIGDGEMALWPGMSLSGIEGTIAQGDTAEQLVVALSGSYGGSSETLWQAEGWLEPRARRGQLSVVAERFTFDRIDPVLRDTVIKDFENTSVDAKLVIELNEGVADFSGGLNLSGLNVEHPMLAQQRLRDMSFDIRLAASLDTKARHATLESISVTSRGVNYLLSGDYLMAGGIDEEGVLRQKPRLAFRAQVPKTDCQAVLRSIPAGFVPKLQGFQIKGPFSADVKLEIDWQDLEGKTVLDGYVGLPSCKVLGPSAEFDAERLQSSFEHQILVGPEQYETVDIGMESDNYAQVFDISSYFLNAVLTQEDSRFYDHNGFIVREFRSALVRNLKAGHFKFGASSISMQMVKNVFLYRDKTISRKLQELFLTWYVERTLEKNRILEIYVNAIEYGPGIYGIVAAADTYFDKHPRDISPREAAFLAQLLPSPRKRYFQYCKDRLTRRTSAKIGRILGNMRNRNRLTSTEFAEAKESKIEFNPQKVRELCRKPPNW